MKLIGVSDDQAGFHVGPAGDLDGDGFQDVIVGAFQAPTNGPGQGGLHLVYGPVTPGSICLRQDADARLLGELTGAFDKTYRDDPCAQDVLDQLAEQKSN